MAQEVVAAPVPSAGQLRISERLKQCGLTGVWRILHEERRVFGFQ